jgi:hypothetical protein
VFLSLGAIMRTTKQRNETKTQIGTAQDVTGWVIPRQDITLNRVVSRIFVEHLAATVFRDSILDGYSGAVTHAAVRSLRSINCQVLARLASRHDYRDCPTHPHATRNFVAAPLFRADRESAGGNFYQTPGIGR